MINNSVLSTNKNIGSNLSLRARFLAGIVVLCILVNGFVPRFSIDISGYETLSKIMKQQSTLLKFFSLSTLPLNIVTEVFMNETAGQTAKNTKKTDNKEQRANASDFSIIALERSVDTGRNINQGSLSGPGNFGFSSIFVSPFLDLDKVVSPNTHTLFLLVFLVFFFLLPRSSVGDGYYISILNKIVNSTQLERSSWVFYFLILNSFTRRLS